MKFPILIIYTYMISINQIKLIVIVVIVAIITMHTKYFTNLKKLYKTIANIPKVTFVLVAIATALGISIYNPFRGQDIKGAFKDISLISKSDDIADVIEIGTELLGIGGGYNKNNAHNHYDDYNDYEDNDTNDYKNNYKHKNINDKSKKYKRNVTEATKKLVAARQQWLCGICKATLDETYEIDHINPLYKGGTNDPNNLMAIDPICHRKKTNADRLGISIDTYLQKKHN